MNVCNRLRLIYSQQRSTNGNSKKFNSRPWVCQIASWKFLFNLSNDCVMYIHIFYCAITKCGELWFRFKLVHDSTSREINDGNVYFTLLAPRISFLFFFSSTFFSSSFLSSSSSSFSFFSNFYSIHPSTRSFRVEEFPRIYANASALCDYENHRAETFDFRINNYLYVFVIIFE